MQAVLLYSEDNSASTLRTELHRLRSLLVDDLLASRPYRLVAEVTADWLAVEAQLASGDVVAATQAYRGPLLLRSVVPRVVRLRTAWRFRCGKRLWSTGSPRPDVVVDPLVLGADDYDMWLARAAVGATSPLLPLISDQIARLDREFDTWPRDTGAVALALEYATAANVRLAEPSVRSRRAHLTRCLPAMRSSSTTARSLASWSPPARGCQRTKRLVRIIPCRARASRHEAPRPRPR